MWRCCNMFTCIITESSEHCVHLTVKKLDFFQSMHTRVNFMICIHSLTNRRGVFYQQPLRMKARSKEEEYYCPHRLVFVSLDSEI